MYKYITDEINTNELISNETILNYVGGMELLRNTGFNELKEIITEASLYYKVPRSVVALIIEDLLNKDMSLTLLKRTRNK